MQYLDQVTWLFVHHKSSSSQEILKEDNMIGVHCVTVIVVGHLADRALER